MAKVAQLPIRVCRKNKTYCVDDHRPEVDAMATLSSELYGGRQLSSLSRGVCFSLAELLPLIKIKRFFEGGRLFSKHSYMHNSLKIA